MSDQQTADVNRRSERARRAIHAATRELVGEQGFAKVTVEAIAARAGVGKQTIYRWWPSKCAVVLDVLIADNVHGHDSLALPDTGDLAADVRPLLIGTVAYFTDPTNDKLLRAITAEIQYDTQLAATVLDELLRPQFDALVARIAGAGLTTPSGSPADPQIVAEQLVGPILHRWLLRRAPLDEDYINNLVDHVIATSSKKRPSRVRRPSARTRLRATRVGGAPRGAVADASTRRVSGRCGSSSIASSRERRDGVVASRVEDGRLNEQRPLRLLPRRTLDHGDVDEPRGGEPGGAVDPAHPLRQGVVVPVPRLPVADHGPPAGPQHPAELAEHGCRLGDDVDGVDAHHAVDGRAGQACDRDVGDDKASVASQHVGALAGLADRFGGEVDPDERGAGAGGDFESVAASPAGEVDQRRWCPRRSSSTTSAMPSHGSRLPDSTCAGSPRWRCTIASRRGEVAIAAYQSSKCCTRSAMSSAAMYESPPRRVRDRLIHG